MAKHKWVAAVACTVPEEWIREQHEKEQRGEQTGAFLLNNSNLLHEPQLGCYVCERPLDKERLPEVLDEECPGEPEEGWK